VRRSLSEILDRGGPADAGERFWLDAWHTQLRGEPEWRELLSRVAAALRALPAVVDQ
jgi:hypothetical protein